MPDPKLKAAADEIKAILMKHDIMGCVMLSSESHIEFVRHLVATWSCATMAGPNILRVKCKLVDYGGDKAAQKKALESTLGCLIAFSEQAERDAEALTELVKAIGSKLGGVSHISRFEEGSQFS